MAQEIRLPQLGKAMRQATIVRLAVQLGQTVTQGDILCELETDKATLELDSPADGVIAHIFAQTGQSLPVNCPLFVLTQDKAPLEPGLLARLQQEFDSAGQSIEDAPAAAPIAQGANDPRELLLSRIRPATGPIGAVQDFAGEASATESYALGKKIPISRWQRIIAEKMLQSKQQCPCFYLNVRADVTDLMSRRESLNAGAPHKYSINDFILLALAKGLKAYPVMTGSLGKDCIHLPEQIDIGMAIATDFGLAAPVVRDIANKTLAQISADCRDLVHRTRQNTLTADDLAGGCMTISNLGAMGIDSFIPILVPGHCSILGIGRVSDTAVPASGGKIEFRKMMNLNLSVDHRIANGAEAAQFLDFTKKLLEHPGDWIPA